VAAFTPSVGDLLTFHFECLQGMYFSEHRRVEGGALLFSDSIEDSYYNFFAPTGAVTEIALSGSLAREFERRGRRPAVYLTPEAATEGEDRTLPADAEVWARDAWLVGAAGAQGRPAAGEAPLRVFTVGAAEREAYVATFTEAYSGDDPDDPYGQLDVAYSESLRASFDTEVPGYRKHYVMASVNDQPVGVAVMFTAGPLAGVYGVGTVPGHRKAGVGAAIMRDLARIASGDGASAIMLQTESGSAVQRWYEHLGYRHVFDAAYVRLATDPGPTDRPTDPGT
jgi:GNAT superfamily N-acetyltransferase